MLVIAVEQIEYFKEGLFISFRKLPLPCRGPPKCFAVLLRDAPKHKMVRRRHVTTNRPGHRLLDCSITQKNNLPSTCHAWPSVYNNSGGSFCHSRNSTRHVPQLPQKKSIKNIIKLVAILLLRQFLYSKVLVFSPPNGETITTLEYKVNGADEHTLLYFTYV